MVLLELLDLALDVLGDLLLGTRGDDGATQCSCNEERRHPAKQLIARAGHTNCKEALCHGVGLGVDHDV
eukprot:2393885-Pyramimonas_sp.AAC.1